VDRWDADDFGARMGDPLARARGILDGAARITGRARPGATTSAKPSPPPREVAPDDARECDPDDDEEDEEDDDDE
jgi:hypothetical protein